GSKERLKDRILPANQRQRRTQHLRARETPAKESALTDLPRSARVGRIKNVLRIATDDPIHAAKRDGTKSVFDAAGDALPSGTAISGPQNQSLLAYSNSLSRIEEVNVVQRVRCA